MDDSADSFGKLSLNAKEWRPGQGFTPASSSSSCAGNASVGDCNAGQNNARQDSASSPSREGSSGQVSRHSQSSWGGGQLFLVVELIMSQWYFMIASLLEIFREKQKLRRLCFSACIHGLKEFPTILLIRSMENTQS
mmetsp:Transcript_13815/g.27000  ORF Transcript_13815/g.27000 Transcript_13815/m.27000 type:complete len:137 (-) Transcript_13815:2065-2475(-)